MNIRAFLAVLQDRSEGWTATVTLGSTNEGRGVDLAIFAGIWDELLLSGAPECATIGVSRGRWWPVNQLSPPLRARDRPAGAALRLLTDVAAFLFFCQATTEQVADLICVSTLS